jgi:serine/threonine protein kinase
MMDGWDEREVSDLADEYEMLGELGRGASAVVYRARDRVLGRLVAIKVVRAHSIASADDALQRLAREARTVARLHHPNIVTVHAVKRLASGGLALVMQLVPGRTLKETLAAEGPMAPERVERVLRDVAEALAYANIHGVVHRDVKPENIFLDAESGRAMLSDFGIAFSVEHESRLTVTGATIGTPAYMAPEQIDGAPANARSDLYSLGVVAWEMLSGQRPWAGQSLFNVILKQKTEELPPIDALRPGEVPERLQYLIERMMQKRPGARFAGAEGLIAKLDRWSEPPDWSQWQAAHRRRRVLMAGGGSAGSTRPTAVEPTEADTVVFRR